MHFEYIFAYFTSRCINRSYTSDSKIYECNINVFNLAPNYTLNV